MTQSLTMPITGSHLVRTIDLQATYGPFTGDEDFAEEQSDPTRLRFEVVATVDGVVNVVINGTTATYTVATDTEEEIRTALVSAIDAITPVPNVDALAVGTEFFDLITPAADFGSAVVVTIGGAQAANLRAIPNWGLTLYKVDRAPLIWRCVACDENGLPIPADGLTVDACLFKVGKGSDGNKIVSRTAKTSENSGGSQQSTQVAFIDDDVVPGEIICFGILAVTNPGSVEQIKIFADSVVRP